MILPATKPTTNNSTKNPPKDPLKNSANQRLSLRTRFAIALGRAVSRILRLFGRGATTLPGRISLIVDPVLLSHLTAGRQVFLVTGTNGKTTTVRIICTLLEQNGVQVTTNTSGANLDTGLATTLISAQAAIRTADRRSTGNAFVFEIDEAYFGKIADQLNPAVAVVTNFFRDQLDRYGELRTTRNLIEKGLTKIDSDIVLNADDSLCASLGRYRPEQASYFAMAPEMLTEQPTRSSDEASYCTYCGERYQYNGRSYGHLGRFHCPQCGFTHPEPDLTVQVLPANADQKEQGQQLLFRTTAGEQAQGFLPIPGIHNAYNAAAAVLALQTAGYPLPVLASQLAAASPAFGRMERFSAEGREVCLLLVKNPVGMDRALEYVTAADDFGGSFLLLNSEEPDGRDISWIWDVDFESNPMSAPVYIAGKRCHDLALRLYYGGQPRAALISDPDSIAQFERALAKCPVGRCLYILPNYTAMLHLRAYLADRYNLRPFWE